MNLITTAALTMSSREIAELTEKRHDNVMADIRTMCTELGLDVLNFQGTYRDSQNRQQIEYHLDRELTETLVTGYSIALRHKVIRRLHELEQAASRPMTPGEQLLAQAQAMIGIEQQQRAQQAALERVESRTARLEQVRYLESVPNGFESITTIRTRINRRHGLPEWLINYVMRELNGAPMPFAMVRSKHADDGGQPFAIWPKPAVTQRFDQFVSQSTYVTAERATHPDIPHGRFKIHRSPDV